VAGLSSRLTSLGSTLDILVRENWSEVRLEDLIAGQLGHFSEDITRRIAVAPGPLIKFTASEAQMLGLALHELGTNAAKYGALSVTGGRVDISWREEYAEEGAVIALLWREENGPPVTPPARHGFGSRITESLVARSVGGTAVIDYRHSGLTWTLTFPRARHTNADADKAADLAPPLSA
jgi:two-component sensor histidine kinase